MLGHTKNKIELTESIAGKKDCAQKWPRSTKK
jgi:hypothetical protein